MIVHETDARGKAPSPVRAGAIGHFIPCAPDAGNAVILAVIYFMIALLPLPVIFGVMRAVGWALRRFWRASDRP